MISQTIFILAQALESAPSPQVKPPDQGMHLMIMMAFAFGLIYFMSIRPQQKRAKELAAQIASVKTGDKVITSGGIHGIVANIKEGTSLSLKVADNVRIEIEKSAIATIVRSSDSKPETKPVEAKV